MAQVQLYDTTLRDGAQMEGMSLSVEDKLQIASSSTSSASHYIEGGWPGSNPKDAEFFVRAASPQAPARPARRLRLDAPRRRRRGEPTRTCAPCSTRARPSSRSSARRSDAHVRESSRRTQEENLAMIADSVRSMKRSAASGLLRRRALLRRLRRRPRLRAAAACAAAASAGADCLVLCDTNGGMTTRAARSRAIERRAARAVDAPLGIHMPQRRRARGRQLARRRRGGRAAGAGLHQRLRRALRQRQHRRRIIANLKLKIGHRRASTDEQLAHADRGLALRQRGREHGAEPAGSRTWAERLRAQGRATTSPAIAEGRRTPTSTSTRQPSATTARVLVSELRRQRNILREAARAGHRLSRSSRDEARGAARSR